MLSLNDEELAQLLATEESDRVERKERLAGDAPTKIREAICAFANDLPNHRTPGVIVVGMRDDGTPAGTRITDELLRSLADMRDDGKILPRPTMVVQKHTVRGDDYAMVFVTPSDMPPVRYEGRIWIRVGLRRAVASAQDERVLNEKRKHRDLPFDLQAVSTAKLIDLQRSVFENEYLPAAFARDVLDPNERSYEQRLASLRMIDSVEAKIPTLLGLLVLSARPRDFIPGAYVQFLRIVGTELADDIQDETAIDGPLAELIRRLDEKMRASNRVAVDLTTGPVERRTPDYPMAAIEQVVRNAIMHRTYEGTNNPVRVTWFDDRIEVSSPGGPYGLVTEKNFGLPGVTDYRNPNLTEAMRTLGFVQRFGVGIATAQRALSANGNPPLKWEVNDRFVVFALQRRP
ncbi:MAG: putative DNA binding domain-containing protein [Polyangiaceae bacterium]|nr:putative DNA binding domain-containing protein [Polyangiaceae bacterium]